MPQLNRAARRARRRACLPARCVAGGLSGLSLCPLVRVPASVAVGSLPVKPTTYACSSLARPPPASAVWFGALAGVAVSIVIGIVFIVLFYVANEKLFTGDSQAIFKVVAGVGPGVLGRARRGLSRRRGEGWVGV